MKERAIAAAMAKFGARRVRINLRALWNETVSEPVPQDMLDTLARLK